ncbi:MAG: flagellar hook basal-body protein [Chlorobi bacterium]|nr:flagellar hook basal-body protein [Chlorobiota bacterium]
MVKGLYTAGRMMNAKMRNLEIVANNLANLNTTGFKRELPFSEVISRVQNKPMTQITDFSDGSFTQTGNTFDLAISGDGFFVLDSDDGPVLTRNGKFFLTENGEIVNDKGYRVRTEGGDLNLYGFIFDKNHKLEITKEGEIKVGDELIDRLMIGKIDDQKEMKRIDGATFAFPNGGYSAAQGDEYEIHQGYLEGSNTNAIVEMQEMIKLNREYESAQKVIKSLDERMARAKEIGTV